MQATWAYFGELHRIFETISFGTPELKDNMGPLLNSFDERGSNGDTQLWLGMPPCSTTLMTSK